MPSDSKPASDKPSDSNPASDNPSDSNPASGIYDSIGRLVNTCGELPGRCFRNSRRENAEERRRGEEAINPYLIGGAVVVVTLAVTGFIPQPIVNVVKTVLNPVINAGRQVCGWVWSWF